MAEIKPITKANAQKVFNAIRKQYREYIKAGWVEPILSNEWGDGRHWYILWEDGPEEWCFHLNEDVYAVADANGVLCEPWYSFVLGLYPN